MHTHIYIFTCYVRHYTAVATIYLNNMCVCEYSFCSWNMWCTNIFCDVCEISANEQPNSHSYNRVCGVRFCCNALKLLQSSCVCLCIFNISCHTFKYLNLKTRLIRCLSYDRQVLRVCSLCTLLSSLHVWTSDLHCIFTISFLSKTDIRTYKYNFNSNSTWTLVIRIVTHVNFIRGGNFFSRKVDVQYEAESTKWWKKKIVYSFNDLTKCHVLFGSWKWYFFHFARALNIPTTFGLGGTAGQITTLFNFRKRVLNILPENQIWLIFVTPYSLKLCRIYGGIASLWYIFSTRVFWIFIYFFRLESWLFLFAFA